MVLSTCSGCCRHYPWPRTFLGGNAGLARADTDKAALYRHFHLKDDLGLAFLQRREERWTYEWLAADATRRGSTPSQERLLAIFDVFDEWDGRAESA